MNKLPNKPSALIRVALTDIELCRKDPKYDLDMNDWHRPGIDKICYVCLAGSVMAKTLKSIYDARFEPSRFDHETGNKLLAIDLFRLGEIVSGLEYFFNFERDVDELERCGLKEPRYRKTKQGYSPAYLNRLADEFERCGL